MSFYGEMLTDEDKERCRAFADRMERDPKCRQGWQAAYNSKANQIAMERMRKERREHAVERFAEFRRAREAQAAASEEGRTEAVEALVERDRKEREAEGLKRRIMETKDPLQRRRLIAENIALFPNYRGN